MRGDLAHLAAIFLAILAMASVAASRRSIAEAWSPGTRLQATSAQVLVTGGMLTASTFVQNREVVQIVVVACFVAIVLFGEISDIRLRRYRGQDDMLPVAYNRTPVALILLFWSWLYVVNLWFMADAPSNTALYRTASGAALFLYVMAQRYRPITLPQFYSAALLTIAAIMVSLPFVSGNFGGCGRFKCNEINALLLGPFPSENFLGMAAAMCAVLFVMAVPVSLRTAIVLVFLVAVVYATYSRTSLLALTVTVGLIAAESLLFAEKNNRVASKFVVNAVSACCAVLPIVVGMALVYHSETRTFSNRGRIWARGREAVSNYPLTGRGLDSWDVLVDSGYFGQRFANYPHSEYLLIYFAGGAIALVLLACMMYRITSVAITEHGSLARGSALPVAFATIAIAETLWNPLSVDFGTWIFFALVAACVPVSQRIGDAGISGPQMARTDAPSWSP